MTKKQPTEWFPKGLWEKLLETHVFAPGAADSEKCHHCGRNRAMHENTGHRPSIILSNADRFAQSLQTERRSR